MTYPAEVFAFSTLKRLLMTTTSPGFVSPKFLYHCKELATGLIAILLAFIPGVPTSRVITMEWASLFRWIGVALLGRGLLRDLVILTFYRKSLLPPETKRGFWLCLESSLGLCLIGLYFLIDVLGGHLAANFQIRHLLLLFAITWLFGYVTRDLVLELQRDPNHLNLVFGFSPKKDRKKVS